MRSAFVVSSLGGVPVNVTARLARNVRQLRWEQSARSVIVNYEDGVSWSIARINVPTGVVKLISSDYPAWRTQITTSSSGAIAWAYSDGTSVGAIKMLPSGSGHPIALFDTNPQIRQWELGEQEVIKWRNHRGEEKEGILIKPINYEEGKRYPLIVDAYPMQGNWFKAYPMGANQGWASRGYAVFQPDPRTPHTIEGFFKTDAFDQAGKGPRGWDVTVDDVVSGVNELIKRGIVDSHRMGLYGFSNGGGAVNYLVTRTTRFKCAVSVAGVYADWLRPLFLFTDSNIPSWAGVTPWDDPEAYVQLSAIFHLDKVTTPMLLADGDNDGDFLLDSIEMYNGLRWLKREVTLLRYPGQGHGFEGKAMEDFWNREKAFFDKYLSPGRSSN
jgi:dipeptidyl aminopeptidase/acylaminoacyl peptidase